MQPPRAELLRVRYERVTRFRTPTALEVQLSRSALRSPDKMRKLRLLKMDGMAAARAQGLEKPDPIKHAVVERNGSISIIKKDK